MEPQIVFGPTVDVPGTPMYYVTLASGHISTNPDDYPAPQPDVAAPLLTPWDQQPAPQPSEDAHQFPVR
jgi:hypothetical protein